MSTKPESLIAQLEAYLHDARAQVGIDEARDPYWRGVLFGLELTLLEARKRQTSPEASPQPADEFYARVNQLVFDHLEELITLCQARINRDLLVYNARATRDELLKAIRQAAQAASPRDSEAQVNPDLNLPGSNP